jgi:DNA-binding SARP family transcriptional activator/class 3 adenylate cyclase
MPCQAIGYSLRLSPKRRGVGQVEFRLLGPLEVRDRGHALLIGGQKPRALLAVLLLNANRVVPTEQLIDALWGDRPPASARRSVQFFVHRLRRTLAEPLGEERPGGLLLTRGVGYVLRLEPEQLDVERFRQLLERARRAHAGGQLRRAVETLEAALALWRGRALADFTDEGFAQAEIARLEELRLAAITERVAIRLELGHHAELVGELQALVRSHPLREQVRAQLILALYRSGRQAEALQAYQAARRAFMEELGIEPGAELQRLEQAVLAHDPALDRGHAGARPALPRPALPRPARPRPGQEAPSPRRPPVQRVPDPGPDLDAAQPPRREERKVVTVLLAALTGGTDAGLDPEDVRERLEDLHRRMTERVERYGGVVQVLVPDRLLAVFGAPRSHEDDAERAVRAALELCAAVAAHGAGRQLRVGVATGEVIVTLGVDDGHEDGAVSAEDRQRAGAEEPLTIVGDVVHAAAALEETAEPGTVAVGSGTRRGTRRAIVYRPLSAASWLARMTGFHAWQALAPRSRPGITFEDARSPLIEREQELGLLRDLLAHTLRAREPRLATIVALPGLGKSRLVEELGRVADQRAELITWRVGHCLPYGEHSAFRALAEVFKAHAGIHDEDPAEVAADKLRQAVTDVLDDPDEAGWAHGQLSILLQAVPADSRGRQQEMFGAWQRFIGALAGKRPLVLVFEDLQWADDALLDFIDSLPEAADAAPLLVLCTAGPELLERRPDWCAAEPERGRIVLGALSREGTAALLDWLLVGALIDHGTRTALIDKAAGNPLYVEEYIRMLRDFAADGGGLPGHATAGTSVLAARRDSDLPMPESVRQLVAARLDALPVEDKLLLQDAAVVGEFGWLGVLAALGDRSREEVEVGLRRLEQRELLRRVRATSMTGETEYAFRHALVREVAYGQLMRAERTAKHQRIAAWLEALDPDQVEDRIELLAHHYEQALMLARASGTGTAALTERTRNVLRAAGDRASAQGAPAAAARFYAAALELWPAEDEQRPGLLLRLGRSLVYSEHRGEEVLAAARQGFEAAGADHQAAEVDVLLGRLARTRGADADVEPHLERAFARSAEPGPSEAAALAVNAIDLMVQERTREAMEAGREAARVAHDLGLREVEGMALAAVGGARLKLGDPDGVADLERSIVLLNSGRDPSVHFCRFDLAWGLWWLGDLGRCATAAADGRRAAARARVAVVHWFDSLQSALHHAMGRWDQALAIVDAQLGGESAEGDDRAQLWCRPSRARIRLGRGELAGALEDADAALELAVRMNDGLQRQVALALRGRILLAAGRREEAAYCLDGVLALQREGAGQAYATGDLAVLVVELGRPAESLPDALAPTRWHEAVRLFVQREFQAATEVFEAMGADADAAVARLYAARQLAAGGNAAAAQGELEPAIAFFTKAGAIRFLAEARGLLGAPGAGGIALGAPGETAPAPRAL